MHAPIHLPFALLLFAAVGLAGCTGGGDPTGTTPPTATPTPTPAAPDMTTLAVATSGVYPVNPGFAPATLTAPAGGEITVDFTNEDPNAVANHDWVLEGVEGAATEIIASGENVSVTFAAPAAGEYTYFCSVGNHRDLGMVGTLTVQ